jgi:hypothetical protein
VQGLPRDVAAGDPVEELVGIRSDLFGNVCRMQLAEDLAGTAITLPRTLRDRSRTMPQMRTDRSSPGVEG